MVDDHSTDPSAKIVADYAHYDPRIKLLKNKGKGIIDALRTAYDRSTGTFITRMDSDDIMLPEKLRTLKNSLQKFGLGHIAVGPVKYFGAHERGEGYAKYENWLNQLTQTGENYQEIYKECVIPSPSWMCHMEDFVRCGAFNGDAYPEDYELTFRFYQHQLAVIPETKVVHHWRDYPTRTSRTHENYANNTFLDLKLHYFLMLDHQKHRPLLIWGAGAKGKQIAKTLLEQKISFEWVCENPNKIGKEIYGCVMRPLDSIKDWSQYQSIVTVANPAEQEKIKKQLTHKGLIPMMDYFFFC